MRIFVDANVLLSAGRSDGAVRRLLKILLDAGHTLCADHYVVAEANRNLELKSPSGVAALEILLQSIDVAAFRPDDVPSDIAALLPEKDQPVLAAAVRCGCEALVTGDRTHFGALYGESVSGVTIHSPRTLVEALSLVEKP